MNQLTSATVSNIYFPIHSRTIENLFNDEYIQKASGFDQIPTKPINLGASAIVNESLFE